MNRDWCVPQVNDQVMQQWRGVQTGMPHGIEGCSQIVDVTNAQHLMRAMQETGKKDPYEKIVHL